MYNSRLPDGAVARNQAPLAFHLDPNFPEAWKAGLPTEIARYSMREKVLQRLMSAAILLCLFPLGVFAQKMEANIPVTAAFIAP